jgi:hypothetical protein
VADAETMIANRALQKLGVARIMSLQDDNKNGRACLACYAALRDAELRRHTWKFAMARAQLPSMGTAPAFGFGRQFMAPADCLRLVQVGECSPDPSRANYRTAPDPLYAFEGGLILTDLGDPLNIRYVKRVTDATRFDPLFAEALAGRMAVEMADELTESVGKAQLALTLYKDSVRDAIRTDAIERAVEAAPDSAWVTGRL